jgi:hypothetical protein
MIIARLKIAVELPLSEDERSALSRRQQDLNRVAECKDVVDQPDAPIESPVQGGGAVELLRPSATSEHPFGQLGTT